MPCLWGGGRTSALRRIASGPFSSGLREGGGGAPRCGWRRLQAGDPAPALYAPQPPSLGFWIQLGAAVLKARWKVPVHKALAAVSVNATATSAPEQLHGGLPKVLNLLLHCGTLQQGRLGGGKLETGPTMPAALTGRQACKPHDGCAQAIPLDFPLLSSLSTYVRPGA